VRYGEIDNLKKICFSSPILGVLIYIIEAALGYFFGFSFGFSSPEKLAGLAASYSFTMLGFLAAMSAFIFSLNRYDSFKDWVSEGKLDVFYALYLASIFSLFLIFIFSIFVFTDNLSGISFKLMMSFLVLSIIQIVGVVFIMTKNMMLAKD
jgi:hypothetical protein